MNTNLARPLRAGLIALGLMAMLLLTWRHVERLGDPWEAGLGGVNSGAYFGYSARWYDHAGFIASGGVPVMLYHEAEPNLAIPYVNHPPLPGLIYALAYKYGGRDEASMRFVSLVNLILLALVLWLALRPRLNPELAALSLLAFATTPIITQYARMVVATPLVLLTMTLALGLWARHRRVVATGTTSAITRSKWAVAGAAFLNAITDWLGYGAAVLPLLDALASGGRQRLRHILDALLLVVLPHLLGVLIHLAWIHWAPAHGGVDLFASFGELFGEAKRHRDLVFADWPPVMGEWMLTGFGWPWLALSGLGLLHLIARPREIAGSRFTWLLLGAGAIPSLIFWRHAIVHEFWPMMLAPGVACLVARAALLGFALAGRASRRLALVAGVTAFCGLAFMAWLTACDARDLLDRYDTTRFRDRGFALNQHVNARDLILCPGDLTADRYYVTAPMIPLINGPEELAEVQDRFRGRIPGVERVFIFWPRDWMEQGHWLKSVPRQSWLPIPWADSDAILLEMRRGDWD
jgi:Dolichyl-phosphate-mannose-protein mannosyltransferase